MTYSVIGPKKGWMRAADSDVDVLKRRTAPPLPTYFGVINLIAHGAELFDECGQLLYGVRLQTGVLQNRVGFVGQGVVAGGLADLGKQLGKSDRKSVV